MKKIVEEKIKNRARSFLKHIHIEGLKECYIAGNCLNDGLINDIDIFPVNENDFDNISYKTLNIITTTKNAITIDNRPYPAIQLCRYHHKSLTRLIESFDFAHVQIGIHCIFEDTKLKEIDKVIYTDNYIVSKMTNNTWFTGSEYPLSSLLRLTKYVNQGAYDGRGYIVDVINILTDIILRGWKDFPDFKDQLDAVDIGLLPDDIQELSKDDTLTTLFELLSTEDK